jgi:hypothetical protein
MIEGDQVNSGIVPTRRNDGGQADGLIDDLLIVAGKSDVVWSIK